MPHGYRVRVIRRPPRSLLAVVALAAAVVLGGCIGQAPAPSPTPTGFADEAEAFAAAEETYRAYVDALNGRRADPDHAPSPETFLMGAALDSDEETQLQLEREGLRILGQSTVERVLPGESATADHVSLVVCLDSSQTTLVDANGVDRTPPDRATLSRLNVDFGDAGQGWKIIDSQLLAEDQC
jgi:hypothetical protein